MGNKEPGRGGFFGFFRRPRKRRRKTHGFVFPMDIGGANLSKPPEPASIRREHRRRRRREVLPGWELFLGFSMVWAALVFLVVILELGSESEWFFVEHAVAGTIDQGTWIIGDKAYMPDGRVMQLENKTAGVSEGRDITNVLGKGIHKRTLKWARIAETLLSLPIIVLLSRVLYARMLRRKTSQ
ncbi:MAG: hypothetical protein ACKVQA_09630 [Burkholderiales bacterium]